MQAFIYKLEPLMQYIALIHKNTATPPSPDDWVRFLELAKSSGMFQGGSEIGTRSVLGKQGVPDSTTSIGGFMRFDCEDKEALETLLREHPVIKHGGSIELCEMPKS